MKAHYENKVMSSVLLYVDHYLVSVGQAYTNHCGHFYPSTNLYNGYHTYSASFKQLVCDHSTPDAGSYLNNNPRTSPNIMKQVYVQGTNATDNFWTTPGSQGMHGINYYNGQVYFSTEPSDTFNNGSPLSYISGNYSVKDFNVYLTNDTEQKILFETKYQINPKFPQQLSGLAHDTQPYPAIFIKNMGGTNKPWALGGIDDTKTNVRLIVLADSSFKLDAACGMLKDLQMKMVPIIDDLPFDAMGSYTGVDYNYENLATGSGPRIMDARVSKITTRWREFDQLSQNVFSAFVDFQLSTYRVH